MNLQTKKEVVNKLSLLYKKATKKEKGVLLKQRIDLTGYNLSYARYVLRHPNKKSDKQQRRKLSRYAPVKLKLKKIWETANYACGQLLVSAIPELLSALERFGEMKVTEAERKLLLQISSATIDRLLKAERIKMGIQGRSGIRPGTLLKYQIPIKIYTPWDEQKPGFLEIDLVAHCGDTLKGEYINTLDAIDIAICWSEKQALMGKGEAATLEAFGILEKRFPFAILGIDVDGGSAFINAHFLRMTQKRKINFTRGRAGKKNDQAHIEQKNYSTVRKIVGYQRFETQEQLTLLNSIYVVLSNYLNFFIPTFKLLKKERVGSRVRRIYDTPKTPYQRVLKHPAIPEEVKGKLRKKYQTLNHCVLTAGDKKAD